MGSPKAKKVFEDNLNYLRERDRQVPPYPIKFSRGLFEFNRGNRGGDVGDSESASASIIAMKSPAPMTAKSSLVRLFVILIIAGR